MSARVPVTIRLASVEDTALLAKLGAETFTQAFHEKVRSADLSAYVTHNFNIKQLFSEMDNPRSMFFIASMQHEAIGYAKLYAGPTPDGVPAQPAIELARLYVLKARWGSGVGAALMKECLTVAHQKKYTAIWLSSWKRNDRANAFYQKWGFEAVGNQTFTIGSDVQEDFIMACRLKDQHHYD